jgi:hypothetical protein
MPEKRAAPARWRGSFARACVIEPMYRSQFVYRFPEFSNLIFYRDHRCAMPIPMAWALYVRDPRRLARIIRASEGLTATMVVSLK